MVDARILIVEDDFSFALELEMMLEELGCNNICKVKSGEEVLNKLKEDSPHLILMDINLEGEMNGIDVAKKIVNEKIPIIFLTSFTDEAYFKKAREVLPVAYLNKPFDTVILKRTIQLALANIEDRLRVPQDNHLFIRNGGKLIKVNKFDVLWVKAEGNYCYLHTEEKKYVMKISLTKLKCKFPAESFLRCHRNMIIQIDKVRKIDPVANKLFIQDVSIPIGSTFRKNVLKRFMGES